MTAAPQARATLQSRSTSAAPPVRVILTVLVIGCVLPVAAMAAFLIFHLYEREQARLTGDAISRARAMTSALERDFISTEAALRALATSDRLARDDLRSFHEQALRALPDLHADSIVVTDADGQLLLSTRRRFGEPLPRLRTAPLLARILKSGQTDVSSLYIGPLTGQFLYTIAAPVVRDGKFKYLLCATAAPAALAGILREQKLPASWRASIIDGDGAVVTRTHDNDKFIGKQVNPDLLRRLASADEGGFKTHTLDDIPVITVYSRSKATRWAVVLGMPLAELTAGLRQTLTWLIIATLAALAAGLALAWRIGGNIAASIIALIEPALALSRGAMQPIPRLHFGEANQLGAALRDAAGNLRRTEAGLHESDQRLALAIDATRLGIWTGQCGRDAIWASGQWRTLFGFSAAQPLTLEDMLLRIYPEDRAAARRMLTDALRDGGQHDSEFRIAPARWIGARISVESDRGRRVMRGVAFDISARKRVELAMRQQEAELIRLSRLTMMGQLSGALAHELNQPLTAILSNAQAAQRFLSKQHVDLDTLRAILADIVDQDKRAGALIDRLRCLFGGRATPRRRIDLNRLVLDVVSLLGSNLSNHGALLDTELAAPAPLVEADHVQLQQLLINLIMNACDAMAAQTAPPRQIVVRTGFDAGQAVRLSVSDCGPGIPPARMNTIFDAFDTSKEHGMGLGLSICQHIAIAHGGRLWAENNPDGGASFHLCLPAAP